MQKIRACKTRRAKASSMRRQLLPAIRNINEQSAKLSDNKHDVIVSRSSEKAANAIGFQSSCSPASFMLNSQRTKCALGITLVFIREQQQCRVQYARTRTVVRQFVLVEFLRLNFSRLTEECKVNKVQR